MRMTRIPLAVLVAVVATVGSAAPTAVEKGGGTPRADAAAGPGRGGVTADACRGGGQAASRAFGAVPTRPADGAGVTARSVAALRPHTPAVTYGVAVRCDGRAPARPAAFTAVGRARAGADGATTTGGATKADIAIGGGLMGTGVLVGAVFWMRGRFGKRV
ncbi:hypothetical protein GCM10014715_41510 [Streptomyces spiralis]|uniref:Integral membrane protein n=2 Tax=Streptomyces spiralis TaxID=66376 RepID=A0A919A1Z6_9ACTN|nr:hypothetical protein GCM10014715_41510 [Streptomyces spiralis]